MSSTGYLQVHAYTSNARMPLENVTVAITDENDALLALRTTNSSGMLTAALPLDAPAAATGQRPDSGQRPYRWVNLYARLENYELLEVLQLQIFDQTVTDQPLQLIPLAELPGSWNQAQSVLTQPQQL